MKTSKIRFSIFVLILFLAVSFLGGSAIWFILGLGKNLDIDGNAKIVRPIPDDVGNSWTAYGGDNFGNRFSKADQITPDNIEELSITWTFRTGALDNQSADIIKRSAFESTPILVEGNLVFCTQFNQVIAIDPGTGKEQWRFDPKIPTDGRPANQFTCRGVSYWHDANPSEAALCNSRLLMGTVDSRLIALDAKTGALCTDFGQLEGEAGQVHIEPSISLRWPGEFQITSAPAIIGNRVITGSAIGDNLRTKAPLGTVHAFDVRTGERQWVFNPIPQNPADPANDSWSGDSAKLTGHANVWSTIAVDEARGLIFLPTSSPSPDYYGGNRIGDNRYANSVVALNAETGEVVWHFQTVHHDLWDYDLPSQPGLYQVWRDNKAHDVVAQVTKTGLVFVLDRDTGKPFLPIEERGVPQLGAVDGEVLSPAQPFPTLTPPIVSSQLEPEDAFGITLWDKIACANQIRALRRDGLFTPPSEQGTLAYPFVGGGANWGSAAFDPSRNLMVVNMTNMASYVRLTKKVHDNETADSIEDGAEYSPMEGAPYNMVRAPLLSPLGLPCSQPPWGVIAGVDIATGEIVWRSTIGTTEDLAGGLALDLGTPSIGGPIITGSGLVFIGASMDDYLRAFNVQTGKELWKGRLPAGGQATPMTYVHNNKQYVVIAAGGHGSSGTKQGDYIVAFALPNPVLPD